MRFELGFPVACNPESWRTGRPRLPALGDVPPSTTCTAGPCLPGGCGGPPPNRGADRGQGVQSSPGQKSPELWLLFLVQTMFPLGTDFHAENKGEWVSPPPHPPSREHQPVLMAGAARPFQRRLNSPPQCSQGQQSVLHPAAQKDSDVLAVLPSHFVLSSPAPKKNNLVLNALG